MAFPVCATSDLILYIFFPKFAIVIKTISIIAILAIVCSIGIVFGQALSTPQTTINTGSKLITGWKPEVECRLVKTHTIQYAENPVTKVEYVHQVKRIPIELGNFSDLEELKRWLADRQNVTTFRIQSPDTIIDCDDYALELQHQALTDGYIMSFEIIGESEYNALFATPLRPSQSLHAINLVIIGNDAYYIEPQTDEVVFVAQLD